MPLGRRRTPKINNLPLVKGDIIRLETSGGGYGPPAERNRDEIERSHLQARRPKTASEPADRDARE